MASSKKLLHYVYHSLKSGILFYDIFFFLVIASSMCVQKNGQLIIDIAKANDLFLQFWIS